VEVLNQSEHALEAGTEAALRELEDVERTRIAKALDEFKLFVSGHDFIKSSLDQVCVCLCVCVFVYLHYTAMFCIRVCLYFTTLHYTTIHYTTPHYTTIHFTALHYSTQVGMNVQNSIEKVDVKQEIATIIDTLKSDPVPPKVV
jgi:hypothetical protein